MPVDDFNATEVRHALAARYGISAHLISVEASGGSLQINVTIQSSPATSLEHILSTVQEVSDADLSAVLQVNLTSTPAVADQMVVVGLPVSCPLGHYCPAGSPAALPCPSGYHSNQTAPIMTSESDCIACGHGVFCPVGSAASTECPAGTIAPNALSAACTPCASEEYQNATGQAACYRCDAKTACPNGQYREGCGASSAGSCVPCTPAADRYFVGPGGLSDSCPTRACAELSSCPIGSYRVGCGVNSAGFCTPCSNKGNDEFYTGHGLVSDACPKAPCSNLQCLPGSIRTGSCGVDETRSNDEYTCAACMPGTFAASGSEVACSPCSAGSHQPLAGAASCVECPTEFYCPQGTSNPLACESGAGIANAVTNYQGATSSEKCVCKQGYYDDGTRTDRVSCAVCPSGTDCSQSVGIDLVTLPVKRGYYRLNESSIDVRRCPDAATNCTGSPECPESTSGCRGTVNQSAVALAGRRLAAADDDERALSQLGCAEGLTGTFCRLCLPHTEAKRVLYLAATTSAQARCAECRDAARDTILLAVGVLLGAAVLAIAVFAGFSMCTSDAFKAKLRVAWRAFTPHIKLKILIGFYMLATKIDSVYEVELPAAVKQLLAAFAVGVSFGINGVSTVLECLGMRGYGATLAIYMLLPGAAAALIVLAVALRLLCTCRLSITALFETAVPLLLKLGFLAYPLVTNVAFDAFSCYTFSDSEWLKADVAIQCSTPEHDGVKRLAWLAILLYPIGLFVLYGALLFAARHAIQTNRPTVLSRAIAFLYREYETSLFWWELVEMLRRLVLVGVMVLAQGSMMQLIVGSLLAASFLLFQVQAAPYVEMADDFLASASSFGLVAMFICATAFKNIALTDLRDVQDKMSTEQKELYVISSVGLSSIMLGSVLGALVLSIVLFVVRFITESARLRQEALASKARRLRYKGSGKEVRVAAVGARHFHTFLSHVWGTGQDQMRIVKQRLLEMIPTLRVFLDVDDLVELSDLEGYIERSTAVLVYVSKGYFHSKNCMRELIAATTKQKPMIALCDSDASHGGLALAEVRPALFEGTTFYEKWGMSLDTPRGEALYDHLFSSEVIEWNRIGHFQDVTMRLIAERLLPNASGATYVDRELVSRTILPLGPPRAEKHVYCSARNPGALELMLEVARARGLAAHLASSDDGGGLEHIPNDLMITTDRSSLEVCDHMLLLLRRDTWTSGAVSAELGAEVLAAMEAGVHLLLAHEMPGLSCKDNEERKSCSFDSFFQHPEGSTPDELLQQHVYAEVAVALKSGPWREVSMTLLTVALGARAVEDVEDELIYVISLPADATSALTRSFTSGRLRALSMQSYKRSIHLSRAVGARIGRLRLTSARRTLTNHNQGNRAADPCVISVSCDASSA